LWALFRTLPDFYTTSQVRGLADLAGCLMTSQLSNSVKTQIAGMRIMPGNNNHKLDLHARWTLHQHIKPRQECPPAKAPNKILIEWRCTQLAYPNNATPKPYQWLQ